MRVSAIVPTFRRPNGLRHALASLRAQRYDDWEAIVVDDGDGEGIDAVREWCDPRVRTLRNPGRGQVDARNWAIEAASGEVVLWLDDDWLEDTDHLSLVVDALADGLALVTRGGWLVEVADGDPVVPVERSRIPFDLPVDAATLRRDNTVLTAGLAYPKELHQALGPLDRELDGYFDWDWHLRVASVGVPVVRLPGLGVAYRQHAGNRSRHVTADRRARFARFASKHGLDAEVKDHGSVAAERAVGTPRPVVHAR
ncbi:MAG: glycosyltransferase family 2 protein [Trueperaceae bacterium]